MKITEQNLKEAAQQLSRSQRGRAVMSDTLAMLESNGLGLDSENQKALLTLIVGAWQSYPQTARDVMWEALARKS